MFTAKDEANPVFVNILEAKNVETVVLSVLNALEYANVVELSAEVER